MDRPRDAVAPRGGTHRRSRPGWWLLVALEAAVAANVVYGGVGLIVNGMGMPLTWLNGTPFGSWVLPGILLLTIVAVPMATAAIAEVLHGRLAYRFSIVAGAALVAWIGAQIVILRRYFFLQPTLVAVGAIVLVLAVLVHRGQSRPVAPGPNGNPP